MGDLPVQLILMHDTTLDRTTNCSGAVTNLNYHGYIEYCVAGRVRSPDYANYPSLTRTKSSTVQ